MLVAEFDQETEVRMREFFESLNEKDRRRYAGLEASKLGHGGISYISEVLGVRPEDGVQRDRRNP